MAYNPQDLPNIPSMPETSQLSPVQPFRFWCQTVLPSIYDDSLSYYELLNKVVDYLNKLGELFNSTNENVESLENYISDLKNVVTQLETYIDEYFTNLDVQTEINNKLDTMVTDGTFNEIFGPVIAQEVADYLADGHTPSTAPPKDTTLTVNNAYANAKTVGDFLYNFRNIVSPSGQDSPVNFSNGIVFRQGNTDITDISETVINCIYSVPRATMINWLANQTFEWELNPYTDAFYTIKKRVSGEAIIVFIISPSLTDIYIGRGTRSSTTYTWRYLNTRDTVYDSTLLLSGSGADSKSVGDSIYGNFNTSATRNRIKNKNTAKYNSFNSFIADIGGTINNETNLVEGATIADVKGGSYVILSESQFMSLVPDFPFTLESGITYFLTCNTIDETYDTKEYYLTRVRGKPIYYGFKGVSSNNVSWSLVLSNKTSENVIDVVKTNEPQIERYCYNHFNYESGYWQANGTIYTQGIVRHTELLRINPSETMYLFGLMVSTYTGSPNVMVGYFFDIYGDKIQPLRFSECTQYEYPLPCYGTEYPGRSNYASCYTCTVPDNAYYFSMNVSSASNTTTLYMQSFSNFDVFCNNSYNNNIIIYNGDTRRKHSKLLLLGPSSIMINRLLRNKNLSNETIKDNNGNTIANHFSPINQYICGFQEYIKPFYDEVGEYGFSGTPLFEKENEPKNSIYKYIVDESFNDHVTIDYTKYDEVLILPDKNGYDSETQIGTYDSVDPTTYCGALNCIINYIYSKNPTIKIYICNAGLTCLVNMGSYYQLGGYYDNPNAKALLDNLNAEIKKLCEYRFLSLYNWGTEAVSNFNNFMYLTYDGTHPNQIGNFNRGKMLKNYLV